MSAQSNSIVIEGNGNVIIQDVNNSPITINTNNTDEVLAKLNKLDQVIIDSLLQVVEKQDERVSTLFKTLLNGIAKEKNVVKRSISNVQSVKIGDETHYHYHYAEARLPKELTLSIPKSDPRDIIGRENDLNQLHTLLTDDKRVVVVNGLGGIGKTTLVQAYVCQYEEAYEHIAWITQTSENLQNDFINTDSLLKILQIEPTSLEPKHIFEDIILKLKNVKDKPNLLVIDNAEQSLSNYKDLLPSQPKWHLLVTSREEISGFHLLPLDFLSEEQAIELFKKHYPLQKLNEQDIKELVQTIDYHTLTIELLAKTAKVQRYDAAKLKEAIEQDLRANVEVGRQSEQVEKIGTYLSTVFSLSKLNEAELWLLKQFACLPSDFHTYNLLEELLIDEESSYKDIFAETVSNIAQKGWLLQNRATDSYKMHRIIAEVVKKEQRITTTDVVTLISSITQQLIIDQAKDNPVDKFVWIPFGKSLLANFSEDTTTVISNLQNILALRLIDLGDYKEAQTLLEKAMLSTEQNLGEDHPDTAMIYSNLAIVIRNSGDYKRARILLEKAMLSDEKNLGKDHPITAIRYCNLGLVLKDLGDYKGAKTLLEKAVLSAEKNFGKDHHTTATNYSNLGTVLQALGDYANARTLLEKAMQWAENNFGKDHPSTARSYSNLAMVFQDLRDYKDAKTLLKKAVLSNEENLGQDHPDTLKNYIQLASVLKALGGYVDAKILLEKAVLSTEKNFGKNHPNTAKNYSRLALVLKASGDYAGAKTFLEKAVLSAESNFGKDHVTTGIRYLNLARVLQDLGYYVEALENCEKVQTIFNDAFPQGHPYIETANSIYLAIRNNLA